MRTNLLSAVAAVALVSIANVAPASAAVFPVGTSTPGVGSFQAAPGPNGTFNGAINRVGLGAGTFSDTFTFTLPTAGFGSGSVISSNVGGVTGLNFSSVTFNGTALTINSFGNLTFAGVNNVQIFANQLNTLVVSGTSAGGASYGGNLTFVPGAVPETATWMMMLAGFGMMGAGLRYRRRSASVKFA